MTYTSKTGYVRCLATGEVFTAETMYLGIYDKPENYEDTTKEEYEKYLKETSENGDRQETI